MKRFTCFILSFFSILNLNGCTGVSESYKEIESLLVVQTMGIDMDKTLRLSLASAANPRSGNPPARLCSNGASISSALENAFDNSSDRHLFFSHIEQVVFGEKAAEKGIDDYLNYICRSPLMRIDVPLYIIRSDSAENAVLNSGDEKLGISEQLRGIQTAGNIRGDIPVYTAADVIRETERGGASLICALDLIKTDGDKEKISLSPNGSAILRDFRLCKYLDREQSIAAQILKNRFHPCELEIKDSNGIISVISINEAECSISPVWDSPGKLSYLEIHIDAVCSVLEKNGLSWVSDENYYNSLTAALESGLCDMIRSCIKISKDLKADYLSIASEVERDSPQYYKQLGSSFSELLPSLEFNIGVSATLNHTNDMKES